MTVTASPLRILIIGAHPDDADIKAGGAAALWRALGHTVQLVSVTDGRSGHQTQFGPMLVERRRKAQAAGAVIGATYLVLDAPDGALNDDQEFRHQIIRLIRSFKPDLVITHRQVDYHPDHRFTGLLIQDAAYLLTVPAVCPETPHLAQSPVIMYFSDAFKKPCPFEAHVVVDIEEALPQQTAMLDCHESQFYEWLPYNGRILNEVPADRQARRQWLGGRMRDRIKPLADRFRSVVVETYGAERGEKIQFIEAFELSEFGAPMDSAEKARLFPFLPAKISPCGAGPRREWADMPGGN